MFVVNWNKMKKIILLVAAMGFTVLVNAQSLTDSLVAYYPFNGNANDASGKGHNSSFNTASLTTDRFGSSNKAYSFDGTTWIEVPHAADLDITGDKTISVWTYIPSTASLPWYPTIISKKSSTSYYPTYAISCLEYSGYGADRYKYDFFFGNGTTNYPRRSTQLYTNYFNQWVHIVGTYSKTKGVSKIYINGNLSDTSITGSISSNSCTDKLVIGRDLATDKTFFNGKIDDIRIYKRVLSSTEIKSLNKEGLGINEITTENIFSIFPNPFSTQTVLQTNKNINNATLTVYNSTGQTVKQIDKLSGQTIIFNRDNLPNGLYFIRLTQDDKTFSADKLVITDN